MKKIKLLTALALASAAFAVSAQNIATVNGKPIPKSRPRRMGRPARSKRR